MNNLDSLLEKIPMTERDACTREKSVFTMFQELTESNEVVRYLISDFGAELVY